MKRAALAALLFATTLAVACADDLAATHCGEIPPGGCPRGTDACRDPSCAAVYVCAADGKWALDRTCALRDASAPPPNSDSSAAIDARARRDATTNVPGASGGPGCEDLVTPDCSLSVALACGQGCCGCDDVFVCESGGWSLWGACLNGEIAEDARDH